MKFSFGSKKQDIFVALDIGSTSIKLLELDMGSEPPRIKNIARVPLDPTFFANNSIGNTEKVAEILAGLLEANQVVDRKACIAMPAPTVFTKTVQVPNMPYDELSQSIQLEAGNYIPHNIDAVKLDYHVLNASGQNQLNVLLVAVKNEIVDSYTDALAIAGVETAVVDVDYFAMQNAFEMTYPEYFDKAVALVNIGARFSAINICCLGNSLFTGNISTAGKSITETIVEKTGFDFRQAEEAKLKRDPNHVNVEQINTGIQQGVEYLASELHRQLSFFWNASGAESGIDRILVSGGAALTPGLLAEISKKTGVEAEIFNPLGKIACGHGIDQNYVTELSHFMAIAFGLAIRQLGDKIYPDEAVA